MTYEYKVIPAPTKGLKSKGIKSGPDRFANALQTAMNMMAQDDWEYVRAETLPCEEREGLMGKTTVYQNVLVFRRVAVEVEDLPAIAATTEDDIPEDEPAVEEVAEELSIEQEDGSTEQAEQVEYASSRSE